MIIRFFAVSALALCAGSFIEEARSAQLFVCGNGKAIEVETDQLEAAKRSNPCVARHFGLKIQSQDKQVTRPDLRQGLASAVPKKPATRTRASNTKVDVVLPIRKPATANLRKSVASRNQIQSRAPTDQIATATSGNYRKVRILNAAPGSSKWFNHNR